MVTMMARKEVVCLSSVTMLSNRCFILEPGDMVLHESCTEQVLQAKCSSQSEWAGTQTNGQVPRLPLLFVKQEPMKRWRNIFEKYQSMCVGEINWQSKIVINFAQDIHYMYMYIYSRKFYSSRVHVHTCTCM